MQREREDRALLCRDTRNLLEKLFLRVLFCFSFTFAIVKCCFCKKKSHSFASHDFGGGLLFFYTGLRLLFSFFGCGFTFAVFPHGRGYFLFGLTIRSPSLCSMGALRFPK